MAAVKFQSAFYEAFGPQGLAALHATVEHAKRNGLLAIFDGKRNDIGSTAEAYARAYLGKVPVGGMFEPSWHADAMTVNPYLGTDGVMPFVKIAGASTRESSCWFGPAMLRRVTSRTCRPRGYPSTVTLLASCCNGPRDTRGHRATTSWVRLSVRPFPISSRNCAAMPGILFLVPGYGTQGGTSADIAPAFDEHGLGAIVNNSRGITFAYECPPYRDRFSGNWQAAVDAALKDMIDDLAANTPAGQLRGK